MKWTVSAPRDAAEDDLNSVQVEADSIEEAIVKAAQSLYGKGSPHTGQVFNVHARVEMGKRPLLPLRSV